MVTREQYLKLRSEFNMNGDLKDTIYEKFNGKCRECSGKGVDVHHKKPIYTFKKSDDLSHVNHESNLELLCKECHYKIHRKFLLNSMELNSCPRCKSNDLNMKMSKRWIIRKCGSCGYDNIINKKDCYVRSRYSIDGYMKRGMNCPMNDKDIDFFGENSINKMRGYSKRELQYFENNMKKMLAQVETTKRRK